MGIKDSLLINATPMGLLEGSEVPEGIKKQMKSFVGVLDMVYLKEGKTELCNLAEQEGLPHLDGKLMLAAQAQEGFYFFTGQKEPVELFLDSLMEALKKESNDG